MKADSTYNLIPGTAFKVFLFLIAVTLSGCSSDNTGDLRDYVAKVKARPKGRIEPLPEIKPYETYIYNVNHLRDPFTPDIEEEQVATEQQDTGIKPPTDDRKKEELEQFSLDSLTFVGTIEKNNVLWGLIAAPDKAIYRVRPGNYMGTNYGKILAISEDAIEMVEIIPNGMGGWVERDASLSLAEPQ